MSSNLPVSTAAPDSTNITSVPNGSPQRNPLWLRVSGGLFGVWVIALFVLTISTASRGQIIPRQIRLSDAVAVAVVFNLKTNEIQVNDFWVKRPEQEKAFSNKTLTIRNLREVNGLRDGSRCLIPVVKLGPDWVIPGWEGPKAKPVVYADTPENRETIQQLLIDQ